MLTIVGGILIAVSALLVIGIFLTIFFEMQGLLGKFMLIIVMGAIVFLGFAIWEQIGGINFDTQIFG